MPNDTQTLVSPEVNAVLIQLPSPWPSDMAARFHSVEAQFHCRRITQELTMYFYVYARAHDAEAWQASFQPSLLYPLH